MQVLTGARVFDGETILNDHAVVLEGERISAVVSSDDDFGTSNVLDLKGGLLAPGFIDIQVNGGGGVLLNDKPDLDSLQTIFEAHRQFGTTAMLPTIISDDFDVTQRTASAVREALRRGMPGIVGVHFEGPYLNIDRKGVHDPEKIRPFENKASEIYCSGDLGAVIVTLAPECAPEGVIKKLADAGVRVSAGHTAGTYEDIRHALDQGISGFTHLFNAMTPMESRSPGVVGAALEDESSWCGIIVDGHHVHPVTLKNAIAAKPSGKMMLVSDAMPTVGSASNRFEIRGEIIEARDGVCATADGTLAGSDLDMASAVRNSVNLLGLELAEALRMASLYPAQFIGLDQSMGRIANGYRADMVLLHNDLNVTRTWVGGQMETHI